MLPDQPSSSHTAEASIHALLVEDDDEYALLVERALGKTGELRLSRVCTLGQALDSIGAESPDVVLLDLSLPDSDVENTIRRAGSLTRSLPVLVLTGNGDRGAALRALSGGVDDYFIKDQMGAGALEREVRAALSRRGAGGSQALSQLVTPAEFRDAIRERIASSARRPFCVSYIELDEFDEARDATGEGWAHRVVRSAVEGLRLLAGEEALMARLGEQSFGILHTPDELAAHLGNGPAIEGAKSIAGREQRAGAVTASIGTARCPEHGTSPSTLISRAAEECAAAPSASVAGLKIELDGGERAKLPD